MTVIDFTESLELVQAAKRIAGVLAQRHKDDVFGTVELMLDNAGDRLDAQRKKLESEGEPTGDTPA